MRALGTLILLALVLLGALLALPGLALVLAGLGCLGRLWSAPTAAPALSGEAVAVAPVSATAAPRASVPIAPSWRPC